MRPSDRELSKKIKEAQQALQLQGGIFANPAKAVEELYNLCVQNANEIWQLIIELLEEITPKDYEGGRPPLKSYEKTIEGQELFAFCWCSIKLGKKMYIKFALKNNKYYYVSLHPSRYSEQTKGD